MVAVIDLETDSVNPEEAKIKFFGGLDLQTGEYTILKHTELDKIKLYISNHQILIGFNLKGYDNKILERYDVSLKYKVIVDLYEALAPKGDNGFGIYNKNRLQTIRPDLKLQNYKLATIVEALGLDNSGKGDIDYNIFKKDEWTKEEEAEIIKYLKQDLLIEKKLFDWYKSIFKPLEPYLDKRIVEKNKHLTCTTGCLAYRTICHQAGYKEEYNDKDRQSELKSNGIRVEGGHHIHARWEKVRGNIICRDAVSMYPHNIIQGNLHNDKINNSIKKLLTERLLAKANGDKNKSYALKIVINSIYGICNEPSFKHIYNPKVASECTRMGRESLKRYAKTLEVAGFIPLYGFTDSVFCGIPKTLTSEDLDIVTKKFVKDIKLTYSNPVETYDWGIDKELKFMWFIDKKDNNYLMVDKKDKVSIKGGLFNINCPKCVTKVFDEYICPKIVKDLDVNFTREELQDKLFELIEDNPELAGQEYSVRDLDSYKSHTSIQAQISNVYGAGKHLLIPNNAGIGAGKLLNYCSIEDFKKNNLSVSDISTDRMLRYFKPFYSTKEEVFDLEASE